jgi:malonyl CoA-acyl carrier protein transacylase
LSANHTAFVFPAFTSDGTFHSGNAIPGFEECFLGLLKIASVAADPALANYSSRENEWQANELLNQYVTYTYSCAAAVVLRKNGTIPAMNAGYSMGIYAALFDAECISFETGLDLIRHAYESLNNSTGSKPCGMGTIIGLDREDILHLIPAGSQEVYISNQNASHSFVVSGRQQEIMELLRLATNEGALHVRFMDVSIPYHTPLLKDGASVFSGLVGRMTIESPNTRLISLIDQRSLSTPQAIRDELTRNLFHPLNWMVTMQQMSNEMVTDFIECGPSKGLAKNARFVEGSFRFHTLDSLRFSRPPATFS